MIDANSTINESLNAIATKQPAPGGGAVAALSGALAVALGEMVLNYSINRRVNSVDAEARLHDQLRQFELIRPMLLELLIEDQVAFDEYKLARKQGDASEELIRCIAVPRGIAGAALAVLKATTELKAIVNPNLRSDLSVSGELAMTTLRCAIHCVRVNLPELSDEAERKRLNEEADQLIRKGVGLIQRMMSDEARHI